MTAAAESTRSLVRYPSASEPLRGGLGRLFDARNTSPAAATTWIWDHFNDDGTQSCAESAIRHGWTVEIRELDAARGGIRAMLLPRLAGGFTIIVDPAPAPTERDSGLTQEQVISWRLAHEYTHTLFYRGTDRPTRRGRADRDEELFCDAVATTLTGIDTTSL